MTKQPEFDVSDEKDYFLDEEPTVPIVMPRVATADDLRAQFEADRANNPCDRPTKNIKPWGNR